MVECREEMVSSALKKLCKNKRKKGGRIIPTAKSCVALLDAENLFLFIP